MGNHHAYLECSVGLLLLAVHHVQDSDGNLHNRGTAAGVRERHLRCAEEPAKSYQALVAPRTRRTCVTQRIVFAKKGLLLAFILIAVAR